MKTLFAFAGIAVFSILSLGIALIALAALLKAADDCAPSVVQRCDAGMCSSRLECSK